MLVLFANLKAGFSPSEPDGAGVVSIWIPASHHSVPFHSEFSITENEPLPKNYLLETKQTKVKERWISEEGMLTFDNNLNRLLSNGFRWGRIVRLWVIRWGLILVRWGLVAVRRPRSRVGVWWESLENVFKEVAALCEEATSLWGVPCEVVFSGYSGRKTPKTLLYLHICKPTRRKVKGRPVFQIYRKVKEVHLVSIHSGSMWPLSGHPIQKIQGVAKYWMAAASMSPKVRTEGQGWDSMRRWANARMRRRPSATMCKTCETGLSAVLDIEKHVRACKRQEAKKSILSSPSKTLLYGWKYKCQTCQNNFCPGFPLGPWRSWRQSRRGKELLFGELAFKLFSWATLIWLLLERLLLKMPVQLILTLKIVRRLLLGLALKLAVKLVLLLVGRVELFLLRKHLLERLARVSMELWRRFLLELTVQLDW